MNSPLQRVLQEVFDATVGIDVGAIASYIPVLANVNPEQFAISIATVQGRVYNVGDYEAPFTIQSISKPFVYGLALEELGVSAVMEKVDVEPSGDAFNAISLDSVSGRPRNPFINAGAIAVSSLVPGDRFVERLQRVSAMFGLCAGRGLSIDENVFQSEKETGHRNRAIAHLLRNAGILTAEVEEVLDLYFKQCSFVADSSDLAIMAATLANSGVNPLSGQRVFSAANVERVLSVMSTCGMYDAAGSWAYRVGLPAKSGVSGGIVAVLPGQLGISVFSPRLDQLGNSVRGVRVFEMLSSDFGLHLLRPPIHAASVVRGVHSLAQVPSRRQRTAEEIDVLREHGGRVRLVQLQGPIALSNAEVIFHEAMEGATRGATFIFDFKRVDAIEPSVARLFGLFTREVSSEAGEVIFAGLEEGHPWRALLECGLAGSGRYLFFASAAQALERCEEMVLQGAAKTPRPVTEMALEDHPFLRALSSEEVEIFERLCSLREFPAGQSILRQGEQAQTVYLVVRGLASVSIPLEDGTRHRVATLGPGTSFGELSLLDNRARTADVDSDTPLACHVFNAESLLELEEGYRIQAKLFEGLARDLAARLRRADEEIAALAG